MQKKKLEMFEALSFVVWSGDQCCKIPPFVFSEDISKCIRKIIKFELEFKEMRPNNYLGSPLASVWNVEN